jgi:hypothetical protein
MDGSNRRLHVRPHGRFPGGPGAKEFPAVVEWEVRC